MRGSANPARDRDVEVDVGVRHRPRPKSPDVRGAFSMEAVAERIDEGPRIALLARKLSLECSSCGYGIVRAAPPERCPMCSAVEAWVHAPWRPFNRQRQPA
jgi:rubrerythrin